MYARRQGRIFNLYSEPITDFDNPPDDFLIGTESFESLDQFKRKYPSVKVVEKVVPEPPSATDVGEAHISASQLKKQMSNMGLNPEQIAKISDVQSVAVPTANDAPIGPVTVQQYNPVNVEVLNEFRMLLAKHYANPKDERTKIAVQAVGSFIIRLAPHMREHLEKAKMSFQEEEFKL